MENVAIAALSVTAAWFLLPGIVGQLFDYSNASQLELTRRVLVASVFFFAAMNMCNLYKPTIWPWMEAVSYFVALVFAGLVAVVAAPVQDIEFLLFVAGAAMFLLSLGCFFVQPKQQQEGS
jgi:hypothetical protein